uniref:hypothetical protein n=1 Tax=uncultured Sphingomonas sp. TaxID=158754 RepID=UPI0035CC1B44
MLPVAQDRLNGGLSRFGAIAWLRLRLPDPTGQLPAFLLFLANIIQDFTAKEFAESGTFNTTGAMFASRWDCPTASALVYVMKCIIEDDVVNINTKPVLRLLSALLARTNE